MKKKDAERWFSKNYKYICVSDGLHKFELQINSFGKISVM